MRKRFDFWLFDKSIVEWFESIPNRSEFIRDFLTKLKNGELNDTSKFDLQRKKLEVDIRYKEIMIKIKEKELLFGETFDKTPSYSAQKAIKVGVNTESYNPPEEKKINEVIKNSWNKFVETLKQNSKGEWTLTCKLCSTGFILPDKEQAINRLKIHLEETHSERVLE